MKGKKMNGYRCIRQIKNPVLLYAEVIARTEKAMRSNQKSVFSQKHILCILETFFEKILHFSENLFPLDGAADAYFCRIGNRHGKFGKYAAGVPLINNSHSKNTFAVNRKILPYSSKSQCITFNR